MPNPEIKFNPEDQLSFDRAFPPAQVQAFEQEATDDWIGIFEALSAFNLPEIEPEGKKKVVEQLLAHKYGSQIIISKTEYGLKVYRRDITPLLKASQDVFLSCVDLWTKEQKDSLNLLFSPKKGREEHNLEDWKK